MANEGSTLSTVKGYILAEFLPGEDPDNLTPDTPLMSGGILDSLATLKLITFLESEFGVQIEAHEADRENFDTLHAICRLVDSKR
jgi:acyl carrier protein